MKDSSDRFRPLKTPGKEAAARMDVEKDRKIRIASYIDRTNGFLGEPSEEKYRDALEKFCGEQFEALSPESRFDMQVAITAVADTWQKAYERQANPNPSLERMHTRAQELKRWIEEKLGGVQ